MVVKHRGQYYNITFSFENYQNDANTTFPIVLHKLKITATNPLMPSKQQSLIVSYVDILKWQQCTTPLFIEFPALNNLQIPVDKAFLSSIQFMVNILKTEYEASLQIASFISDFYQLDKTNKSNDIQSESKQKQEDKKTNNNTNSYVKFDDNVVTLDDETIQKALVRKVRVTNRNGKLYFCNNLAENIEEREYIVTPFWVLVTKMCPFFIVYSETGKEYYYYEPTKEALDYIVKLFPSAVNDLLRMPTTPTTHPFKP